MPTHLVSGCRLLSDLEPATGIVESVLPRMVIELLDDLVASGEHIGALEEAEGAVRGPVETCTGCRITLAVPAAIAAARAGDRTRLDAWETQVEYLANVVMQLSAWDAALLEVRANRARLDGDENRARELFASAAQRFERAGQPSDQAWCVHLVRW